jgi:putative membrane protein
MSKRQAPFVIEDDRPLPSPDDLPPEEAAAGAASAVVTAAEFAARPRSWLSRLTLWAAGTFAGLALTLWAWDFAAGLAARSPLLSRLAVGLLLVIAVAVVLGLLRELAALARLRRIDRLRQEASALADGAALGRVQRFARQLAAHGGAVWDRSRLEEAVAVTLDADALLARTEEILLAGPDARARREIEQASRRVAAVTALVPLALADVAMAAYANLRMIRAIAEIYGGTSGLVGSWRLCRAVAAHLLATSALAIGDDMIGSVAGGGVLAKLSRRFGEGVINGALTARVGLAALDLCRPMPFRALPRPKVTAITGAALKGLFSSSG